MMTFFERLTIRRTKLAHLLTTINFWSDKASMVALLLLIAGYLLYFITHIWHMLNYPYPLDYGEGPLLAQIHRLRSGETLWHLYGDPTLPPYAIINYPPFAMLLTAISSHIIGNVLLAGRIISLLATLGCVVALAWLTASVQSAARTLHTHRPTWLVRGIPLLFLTIPIAREWAVLLRVDMLGVCLGLWGLVALRRAVAPPLPHTLAPDRYQYRAWAALAGILFALTLWTKPSLIAAPAAGCSWLLLAATIGNRWPLIFPPPASRYRQVAAVMLTVLTIALIVPAGLLEWASAGWFRFHVITANANRWEAELAWQFWIEQLRLRWALALAALLGVIWLGKHPVLRGQPALAHLLLPAGYTLGGIITAIGVGKVGAYSNYFLEWYAGLIWLIGVAASVQTVAPVHSHWSRWSGSIRRLTDWQRMLPLLLLISLLYYAPRWSTTSLHPAGLTTAAPPRLAIGRYHLGHDLQRERVVLAAQARVQTALIAEIRAAGNVIFTDIPGIAAQAGVIPRHQAFEQRQLYDQGQWDQQSVLLELANGMLPLAVIDYLGNWLTPEMIEILQRRYAQDGSYGTFDLYRPVDPGRRQSIQLAFDPHLHLTAYHLTAPTRTTPDRLESGELLVVTLEWQHIPDSRWSNTVTPTVILQLVDRTGRVAVETERPLLYGILPLASWPTAAPIQHMHPLRLPADLPPRAYRLTLTLRDAEQAVAPPQTIAHLTVQAPRGRTFAATGYFVPAPILRTWSNLGGIPRAGYPLTPTVPFAWGSLQCFERICLEYRNGQITQRPLGTRQYLAETAHSTTCLSDAQHTVDAAQRSSARICPSFQATWQAYGAVDHFGPVISGEIVRDEAIVQWTNYARFELWPPDRDVYLGRLGAETLQLQPGMRYRWP